jgi:septal ring factor EnvC (AmiA/AmiB activator)
MTIETIIKVVCQEYNIPEEQVTIRTRRREVVEPRQVIYYLCQVYKLDTTENIGKLIGNRDHATVVYASKMIKNLIETDKDFAIKIQTIKDKLDDIEAEIPETIETKLNEVYQELADKACMEKRLNNRIKQIRSRIKELNNNSILNITNRLNEIENLIQNNL